MTDSQTTDALKKLYEQLPYPPRDPDEERIRLVRTGLDYLPRMSYTCFGGQLNLDQTLKILVAGGGTGDSAIYLGEQTRASNFTIDYIDLSSHSLEIAQKRAQIRGLSHINFTQGSILDPKQLSTNTYDYINCSGVLHHLADPDAGLRALRRALKPGGAIGVMVYAQYGRTAVYQMQNLLKYVGVDESLSKRIAMTRELLDQLPKSNWFKRSPDLHQDHLRLGDSGLADLLLNPSDRAYTVPQMYEWVQKAGLTFIDYASHRMHYRLESYLKESTLLDSLKLKPKEEQEAMAELLSGALIKHVFYAALSPPDEVELTMEVIPVAAQEIDSERLSRQLAERPLGGLVPITTADAKLNLPNNPVSRGFFSQLDSIRPLGKIVEQVAGQRQLNAFPKRWVQEQIFELCELLLNADMLHLVTTPLQRQR